MRVWRKKQKWQVIAALLFAVWILMGTRKINVNAENMEAESFTGETAVETEEETTEKTVTAGIGYRAASADSEGITEQLVSDMGFECEFYQSEYGQFWQDAVFSNEELCRQGDQQDPDH